MIDLDERGDGSEETAPVWAVFGDLMAGLLGAFVLILVGVLVVQMELVANLNAEIEKRLAAQPRIAVPSITFDGIDDGVRPPAEASAHAAQFTGPRSHRLVPGAGHNLPQEAPQTFANAVLELVRH